MTAPFEVTQGDHRTIAAEVTGVDTLEALAPGFPKAHVRSTAGGTVVTLDVTVTDAANRLIDIDLSTSDWLDNLVVTSTVDAYELEVESLWLDDTRITAGPVRLNVRRQFA